MKNRNDDVKFINYWRITGFNDCDFAKQVLFLFNRNILDLTFQSDF